MPKRKKGTIATKSKYAKNEKNVHSCNDITGSKDQVTDDSDTRLDKVEVNLKSISRMQVKRKLLVDEEDAENEFSNPLKDTRKNVESPIHFQSPNNVKYSSSTLEDINDFTLDDSCFGFNRLESELDSVPTSPAKSVSSLPSSVHSAKEEKDNPAHRRVSRSYSKIPLRAIDENQPEQKKKPRKAKKSKFEHAKELKDWMTDLNSEFDLIDSHELKIA